MFLGFKGSSIRLRAGSLCWTARRRSRTWRDCRAIGWEALRGDRTGQHSIRINLQWRICFRWELDGPCDVEIVDYH